ncbi:MAG: YpsA SLOG family protein [Thermoguttaceae bacterium]
MLAHQIISGGQTGVDRAALDVALISMMQARPCCWSRHG